jgi:transposase
LWTVARISKLITGEFGVAYHRSDVWWLLRHRLGFSPQRPVRQAKERDQAAVEQWVTQRWPEMKETPDGAEPAWSSSTSRE